ncbi:hypothetical protein AB0L00_23995 [Actinoallomurus sp. NPDC052308]|uniref:hypothetical protein n=1 Tax=Actinoallomurus sp. NPDC052308 TaxID=3155530 RepID=UPI0034408281
MQFELLAHIQRDPDLRASFAGATREARLGLSELFGHRDGDTALTVGGFYQALLIGMAALTMADPEAVPSGGDILDAFRAVTADLGAGAAETGA